MAQYQPPDKQSNRKRNKTVRRVLPDMRMDFVGLQLNSAIHSSLQQGYNMFFSSHVLRLKQTESGVPSERGSVARLVGTAWKQLTADEKQFYEREADKHNGMHPVKENEDEDEELEDVKRHHMEHYHAYGPPAHGEMHMHPGVPPPMHGGMQHGSPQHDPRQQHHAYYPPHMYGQPPAYGHYDYSQHQRHQQARAGGYQSYPAPRHVYDGSHV